MHCRPRIASAAQPKSVPSIDYPSFISFRQLVHTPALARKKPVKSALFFLFTLSVQVFLLNLYSLELKLPFLTSAETNDEIFMSYSYFSSYRSNSQH